MAKERDCMNQDCKHGYVLSGSFGREFAGEAVGTFFMMFLGVGAACVATLFQAHTGAFQVGLIWGVTVAICIYATRNLCGAHFNPVITVVMIATGRMPAKKFWPYFLGQLVGAFVAIAFLITIFYATLIKNGFLNLTGPGTPMAIFVEQYPNNIHGDLSVWMGALCELLATFCLVFFVFCLTDSYNIGRPNNNIAPLLIGFGLAMVICTFGPLTNACLNPTRDFAPRLLACLAGVSFAEAFEPGIWLVYYIAPLLGGLLAGFIFTKRFGKHQYCGRCVAIANKFKAEPKEITKALDEIQDDPKKLAEYERQVSQYLNPLN